MNHTSNVIEQGLIKWFSPVFGVMLFGEEPCDIDDFGGGVAGACVEFRQLGKDKSRDGILKGVGLDEDKRLFKLFRVHNPASA
jgi:hypothetical protein